MQRSTIPALRSIAERDLRDVFQVDVDLTRWAVADMLEAADTIHHVAESWPCGAKACEACATDLRRLASAQLSQLERHN